MAGYQQAQHAASPLDKRDPSAEKQFQRSYQACLPCRRRKVKCDLGPVDNPHDPPCARCRREIKDCVFSATRRKRKADGGDDESSEDIKEEPAYLARKKSARRPGPFGETDPGSPLARSSGGIELIPLSPVEQYARRPTGYGGCLQQQHNQSPQNAQTDSGQDEEVVNEEAQALFHEAVTAPTEAMVMLLDAASRNLVNGEVSETRNLEYSDHEHNHTRARSVTPRSDSAGPCNTNECQGTLMVDPAITGRDKPPPSQETLKIWSRLRFVRAGWFTASEAAGFINYYYEHLVPLTPITHPDLRKLENNVDLLSEEPMLTVTLLAIASRYMKVTGPGSETRSLMIHEKLWQYLQNMVTRMFWAQEQFGGGFCGAGTPKKNPTPTDKTRLRTLGSIESLLLLSDFHPRAMHFPPSDDDEDILVPDEERLKALTSGGTRAHLPGQSTIARWNEPAVRSDRMSWSLIGFAHLLAYELGVFGTYSVGPIEKDGGTKRMNGVSRDDPRLGRIKRLLYIYMTQASGRFGFPGVFPKDLAEEHMADMMQGFKSSLSNLNSQEPVDVSQKYWVEVISINKLCNDVLFQSKDDTGRVIQTGEYVGRLRELVPKLHNWEARLERAPVDRYTKIMLSIEVNYFLVYVKGFALQAVLEQYTSKASSNNQATEAQSPTSSVSSHISQVYSQNEDYIKGVVESSRKILSHVVRDLLPDNSLKHAPVRAIFRVVSAAIFLLKTFALGAKRSEVDKSLDLLDATVDALRKSVVDDVHLSLRIAELLETLTIRMRKKFIPYKPQLSTSPMRSSFMAGQSATTPQHRQDMRFVRRARAGSFNMNGRPQYLGSDNNITVMPPPRGMYHNTHASSFNAIDSGSDNNSYGSPKFNNMQRPSAHISTFSDGGAGLGQTTFGSSSGDDWMTLDLQPVLDANIFANTSDSMLFGSAFGPEIHNNMEYLERLTNDGWQNQGQGGGEGGNLSF